jgi:hypothetical protein
MAALALFEPGEPGGVVALGDAQRAQQVVLRVQADGQRRLVETIIACSPDSDSRRCSSAVSRSRMRSSSSGTGMSFRVRRGESKPAAVHSGGACAGTDDGPASVVARRPGLRRVM